MVALTATVPLITAVGPEKNRDQPVRRIHPILERNDRCVRTEQRAQLLAHCLRIPQLHAEQNNIDRADVGDIVRRLDRANDRLAPAAFNPQANFLHGRQMRAASNKSYVGTRLRQRCSERSTDTAGADNGYLHLNSPMSGFLVALSRRADLHSVEHRPHGSGCGTYAVADC